MLAGCVPITAQANSFALVLYPASVLVGLITLGILAASWRVPKRYRRAAMAAGLVIGISIFWMPDGIYASDARMRIQAVTGEWTYFLQAGVPVVLVGMLVLGWGRTRHGQPLRMALRAG